ncbi:hypothetical protein [Actinomadura vinacea]|uniref:hypothetical protein n=1 Tax=Actinomadura vinacea TaxID=115336 RepID=UPI0031D44C5F
MSLKMSIRRKQRRAPLSRVDRVRRTFRQRASRTSGRIAPAARNTRDAAAGRILVARGWSAPRLRNAGTYVERELGPRMGGMLSHAARRVEPPNRARRGRNAAVTMVAAVSAVGLAGALLSRRGDRPSTADQAETSETGSADEDRQVRTS